MSCNNNNTEDLMQKTIDIVLKPTATSSTATDTLDGLEAIKGFDLNKGLDYDALLMSYRTIGFQATNFSKAVDEINRMVKTNFT
jgi:hypothetical protein